MPESHRALRLRLLPSDSRHLRGGISRSLARKNASRVYIAGHLINEPDAIIPWIRDPHHLRSPTAMPILGVTEHDGRDIAAYLYTLK